MPRRRDRHERGFRGPLAPDSRLLERRHHRVDFFQSCVSDAIARVLAQAPDALDAVIVGIEEVPHLHSRWSGDRVPLSAGLEGTKDTQAQVVLYERPIEHRAASSNDLRDLVHRTLVEQLSTLTGRSLTELGGPGFED